MTTFQCINPAMNVHDLPALLASPPTWIIRPTIVANDLPLPSQLFAFSGGECLEDSALKAIDIAGVVFWMIAVLEPLRHFYNHRLLSEFHFRPSPPSPRGRSLLGRI